MKIAPEPLLGCDVKHYWIQFELSSELHWSIQIKNQEEGLFWVKWVCLKWKSAFGQIAKNIGSNIKMYLYLSKSQIQM